LKEEFYEALIKLEDAMREENLIDTKIYKVFETIMLVQELSEGPVAQIQRMGQEIKEIKEVEGSSPEEEAWENANKLINEQLDEIQGKVEIRIAELDELCEQNNVTIDEIKEISEVLNYREQCLIENEIQLGTNQIITMNIHHPAEAKKE
jgi:hypothetical protein